jgi:hypothetical protein
MHTANLLMLAGLLPFCAASFWAGRVYERSKRRAALAAQPVRDGGA